MARQRMVEVVEQRAATSRLRWLSLHAPDLAREVRAGQLLMVRCTEPGTYDPLLRRALFVAACEPALGQVALLFAPDADPGLRWLARVRPGDVLDVFGPLGRPFQLATRTRSMVLVGEGAAVGALLMLARELLGRGGAATLLVAAGDEALLPPPFLLPADVEYQSTAGRAVDLLVQETSAAKGAGRSGAGNSIVAWADQICAALPHDQVARLRDVVQSTRMRWERGFASVLIETALPCGVGTCGVCQIALRKGQRLACVDGPVVDLREYG